MIKSLTKAMIATALMPISAIVDISTLPSTAYDGKHPFKNTKKLSFYVKKNINDTVKPNT